MCEYCQSMPHKAGCPNAPEPEKGFCAVCGKGVYKDDLEGGVCRECLEKPRNFEEYTPFLAEKLARFTGWWYHLDCESWDREMQSLLCVVLFQRFCQEYLEGGSYTRRYMTKQLEDYVRDYREEWAKWLREEG